MSHVLTQDDYRAVDDKAGLVLHELILRDALARGHTDSIATHYFTALYSSAEFPGQVGPAELARRLRIYDMDAWMFVPTSEWAWPDASHNKYLLFSLSPVSYIEAVQTCAALGDDAGLVDEEDFNGIGGLAYPAEWKDSALGAQLLTNPHGTELWMPAIGTRSYTYLFGDTMGSKHNAPGPTAVAVCWMDARKP